MTSNWSEAAENTNRIYDKLIGEIWERRWGQGEHATSGRVGPSLKLTSKADFDLLMETLALAAWWGGENRVATKSMFERALDVTRAHDIWSSFKEDDGDEMQNLALMFYMRKSEVEGQGLEFTHKTFSEYLVARYMMRFAHQKVSRLLANRDIDLNEAASRWCTFAVQGRCGGSILRFLKNEARLLDAEALTQIHKMMTEVLSYAQKRGLPVQKLASPDFKDLVVSDITGKVNALSVLSSVTLSLRNLGIDLPVNIDWENDRIGPAKFIGTLVDYRGAAYAEDLEFPNFDFRASPAGSFCTCLFSCGSDFSGANFSGSIMYKAFLSACNLENAELKDCSMESADFRNANMARADLTSSDAENSIFSQANMRATILKDVNLAGCLIDEASMDFGWWDAVHLRTFLRPPIGQPFIIIENETVEPGSKYYPDLNSIYQAKRIEAESAGNDKIPF